MSILKMLLFKTKELYYNTKLYLLYYYEIQIFFIY